MKSKSAIFKLLNEMTTGDIPDKVTKPLQKEGELHSYSLAAVKNKIKEKEWTTDDDLKVGATISIKGYKEPKIKIEEENTRLEENNGESGLYFDLGQGEIIIQNPWGHPIMRKDLGINNKALRRKYPDNLERVYKAVDKVQQEMRVAEQKLIDKYEADLRMLCKTYQKNLTKELATLK